jgi:hemoglobin
MHEHVEIGSEARDAWLACMALAIDRVGISPDLKASMMAHFTRVAHMLRNQE